MKKAVSDVDPVTSALLGIIDDFLNEKGLPLIVKVYPDFASRDEETPQIEVPVPGGVWRNVIAYSNRYYSGGCLELATMNDGEEYSLFHLEDGSHYIPKLDFDMLIKS